jgi:hypothetical protein
MAHRTNIDTRARCVGLDWIGLDWSSLAVVDEATNTNDYEYVCSSLVSESADR